MRLYGPSKIAEQCRLHPAKEISTYCIDCQVPCCATCQVQKHQKHHISTIEDAYLSAENRLNDNVKELEKDVLPTIDQMADKTKKERSEKRVHIDRVREEVNTFRKELKEAVDESCDYLIEKLEHDETELDNLITKLNVQKGKIRELIKEVNEIIQKGDLSMIKYSPPSPSTFIPEVPTPRSTIPVFSPGRDILSIIKDRIGTVEWIEINSESRLPPTSQEQQSPPPEQQPQPELPLPPLPELLPPHSHQYYRYQNYNHQNYHHRHYQNYYHHQNYHHRHHNNNHNNN
ncbi:hypothetical protein FSP39_012828 [Pinctada imbricata]|uniref:B box-type domain-containing protein n=1 Tax=Pinctada imbricata TaxID=66713 RepID=A0AA89BRW1_PINIB|nr:hypothetical protein FSP39_012828 [Pinctada imbricata]